MIQQIAETVSLTPRAPEVPPRVPLSEHYKALLRQLRAQRQDAVGQPWAIGLTSCRSGEGASTVAANLAISAAQSCGDRVLLIDANLAQPAVARTFSLAEGPGLVEAAIEPAGLASCIQSTHVPNLSVLTAGSATSSVIETKPFQQIVSAAKLNYSLIIVDLPTAHELTPCFTLAGALDGIVLIVESKGICGNVAQRAAQQLRQLGTNVIGVVMNKYR